MEENLAAALSSTYKGNLVYSASRKIIHSAIEIAGLNNLLIKTRFELDGREFMFRAMLSHQDEGILMVIQNRITKNYILTGLSGFMHKKPNIHGGFIPKLNSLYFHVKINFFDGLQQEIFFIGKEEHELLRYHDEVRRKIISLS